MDKRIAHKYFLRSFQLCSIVFVILYLISAFAYGDVALDAGWQTFSAPAGCGEDSELAAHIAENCVVFFIEDNKAQQVQGAAFEPGRGYWLYCDTGAIVPACGAPAQAPVTVSLSPGWNLVGNPFGETLWPSEALTLSGGQSFRSGTLVRYDIFVYDSSTGKYAATDILEPWRAYFFYAQSAVDLTLSQGGTSVEPAEIYAAPFTDDTPIETPVDEPAYVAEDVVVSFDPATPAEQALAAIRAAGLEPVGANSPGGVYQVRVPVGADRDAAQSALATLPGARAAVKNYLLTLDAVPDDPVFSNPPAAHAGWGMERVGLASVWSEYDTPGAPVIAVVDTGVDAAHPELAGRVLQGKNFVDETAGTGDTNGHGTQVAGVMAAAGNNGAGMAGVCWNCRVLPVKVCGAGGNCPLFSVLNGIYYAAAVKAPVINVSLGANFDEDSPVRELFEDAVQAARDAGCLVVGAAGNGGADAGNFLPGAVDQALSVAAMSPDDARAGFSNYGPSVDLAAPGADIYTTTINGIYETAEGTSLAAAFVSGAAGLLLSSDASLSPDDLETLLLDAAETVAADQPVGGYLDIAAAMTQLVPGGNAPPRILALVCGPESVEIGTQASCNVQAEDPEGGALTYSWTATHGELAAADQADTNWTAPQAAPPDGEAIITVEVSDPQGAKTSVNITIEVTSPDAGSAVLVVEPKTAVCELSETRTFKAWLVQPDGTRTLAAPQWRLDTMGGSVDPVTMAVGAVDADGVFTPSNQGGVKVTATYQGLSAQSDLLVYDFDENPWGGSRSLSVPDDILALKIASTGSWGVNDTSAFLVGSVFVNVVFIESDGGVEANLYNWDPVSKAKAEQEIRDGISMLAGMDARADASVEFQFETFESDYEPTTRDSWDYDARFINEYLASKGYPAGKIGSTFQLNHDLRQAHDTMWAYTVFVVTGQPTFTDGHSAYAYINGPYLMMTYENGGWGPDMMDMVVMHESGHIFGAQDQYTGSGCECTHLGGYLNTPNSNCVSCSSTPSIMKCNSYYVDDGARAQMGWRDSDNDNILDPVDPEWGGSSNVSVIPTTATAPAGGSLDITARLYNFNGHTIPYGLVSFDSSGGSLSPTAVRTGLDGIAQTTLTAVCEDNPVTISAMGASDRFADITGLCGPAPRNVVAATNCPDVDLTWTPGDDPAYDRYAVKRAANPAGPFTEIATNLTTAAFHDPGPGNGVYYYTVYAYRSANPSDVTDDSLPAMANVACGYAGLDQPCTTDWPAPRCNAAGIAVSQTTYHLPFVKKWQGGLGDTSAVTITPAVSGDKIFFGNQYNTFAAMDRESGAIIWETPTAGHYNVSPVVANNMVIIPDRDGVVRALDTETGAILWQYNVGVKANTPTVADGKVFFGSDNYTFYALNASTGQVLWTFPTGNGIRGIPSVVNGVVYFVSLDRNIYALNADTGQELWRYEFYGVAYGQTVHDGKVFIASSYLYALDAATGDEVWKNVYSGIWSRGVPAVIDGKIIVTFDTGNYGYVDAFNADTGDLIWYKQFNGNFDTNTAVIADGKIFISNPDLGTLYALDPDNGAELASYSNLTSFHSSTPAVAGGTLYMGFSYYILALGWDGQIDPPGNLTATANCPVVNLAWTPADPPTYNRYNVYRATVSGGPYTKIAGIVSASYTDTPPTDGTYYYATLAYKSTNPSDYTSLSNEAMAVRDCSGGASSSVPCGADWPQFSCNSHNGGVSASTLKLPLLKKWEYDTVTGIWGSPAVAGDTVYVNSPNPNGKLHAVDKNTGQVRWTAVSAERTSPAVDDGRVFTAAGTIIYAVDAVAGITLWEHNTGGSEPIRAPMTAANGKIFIGSYNRNMYALDQVTGTRQWNFTTGDFITGGAAVAGGKVFFGSDDHQVYAVDENQGFKIWSVDVGNRVEGTPAVVDGVVYVGYGAGLCALDANTGAKIWDFPQSGSVPGAPAVIDGKVIFSDGSGNIWALDQVSGNLIWKHKLPFSVNGSVAIAGDYVVVGSSDHNVHVLDLNTGDELWRYTTGDQIWSSPAIDAKSVYIGSFDGKLYAFDFAEGVIAPWNVTAEPLCPDQVQLSWNPAEPAAFDRYEILRSTTPGGPYTSIATGISATTYTDTVPGNNNYYYVVRAYQSAQPAIKTGLSIETLVAVFCTPPTSGQACTSNWTMFHCNSHNTGFSASQMTLPITKKFEYIDNTGASDYPVVIHDGVLFEMYYETVRARNKSTGALIWSSPSTILAVCPPTVADGKVYTCSANRSVVLALDESNGDVLWQSEQLDGSILTAVVPANGKLFFGGLFYGVFALDATTGDRIWMFQGDDVFQAMPTVVDGKVFIGGMDHKFYALNENTGEKIWQIETGAHMYSFAPAVDSGMVFFGNEDGILRAADQSTGKIIWTFQTGDRIASTPAIHGDILVFSSKDGFVYALNKYTGAFLWSFDHIGHAYSVSPVIADGKVFIGSDYACCIGYLYILDLYTGEKLFEQLYDGDVGTPAISDGVLYFQTYEYCNSKHRLLAFESADIPLTPPDDMAATVNCGPTSDVDLTWSTALPAEYNRYTVLRSTTEGGPYTEIESGLSTTDYTDTDLSNDTYYYVINACRSTDPADCTGFSTQTQVVAVDCTPPPAPPANVATTPQCGDSSDVDISWSPADPAEYDLYTVMRSLTYAGPYDAVATGLTSTEYTDTGVPSDVYYYAVKACRSLVPDDCTAYSEPAETTVDCTPPAVPPGALAATSACNSELGAAAVSLTWAPASPSEYDRYTVERAEDATGPFEQIATGLEDIAYQDFPPYDWTFHYRVTAYKSASPAETTGPSDPASVVVDCGINGLSPGHASATPNSDELKYPPDNLVDGNLNSWWIGTPDTMNWIIVYHLPQEQAMFAVTAHFYSINYVPPDMMLQVSDDGVNWTNAGSFGPGANTAPFDMTAFSGQSAKYIRIVMSGNPPSTFPLIQDITVGAPQGAVSPDSINTTYHAGNAFDGNMNSWWVGKQNNDTWELLYGLPATRHVEMLTASFYNINYIPGAVTLHASQDGVTWITIDDLGPGANASPMTMSARIGRDIRYLRLEMAGNPASTYPLIRDISLDLPQGGSSGDSKNTTYHAGNAFDGNMNSWWVGDQNKNEWALYYGFTAPTAVDTVTVNYYGDAYAPQATGLYMSDDGETWTHAGTFPAGATPQLSVGQTTTYLKFIMAGAPQIGVPLIKDIQW